MTLFAVANPRPDAPPVITAFAEASSIFFSAAIS
jgi:hypothetical protein